MKYEGLVIHKTPYKERDLIVKILLRSGTLTSLYFYGGQGGGKRKKGSQLELGHMLSIETAPRKSSLDESMLVAKEWKLLWGPEHIRYDYKAYYFLSFICELTAKLSQAESEYDDFKEIFIVTSNALFELEKSVKEKTFSLDLQIFRYLIKLSQALGICPDFKHCLYCYEDLSESGLLFFEAPNGGFSCQSCHQEESLSGEHSRHLQQSALKTLQTKFSDELDIEIRNREGKEFFHYLCFQLGMQTQNFKTYTLNFN